MRNPLEMVRLYLNGLEGAARLGWEQWLRLVLSQLLFHKAQTRKASYAGTLHIHTHTQFK